MLWTPEMDTRLISFRERGFSGAQIASEMGQGLSRNAIIGRVHRLGLVSRTPQYFTPEKIEERRIERERRKNDSRRSTRRQYRVENPLPIRIPAREEIQIRCDAIKPRNLTLIELEENDCRWPFGESPYTFCGHSISIGSYCTGHFLISMRSGGSQ